MSETDLELEPLIIDSDADDDATGGHVNDYLRREYRVFGQQELAKRNALDYFTGLLHEIFGSSKSKSKVTFTVLHVLMLDGRVRWTRAELDDLFHWLKESQRNYIIHRLSNVGWLEYYRDQSMYMISDKGETLMRLLSRLCLGRELVENEGQVVAEIEVSQLLELSNITEALHFLRNRLMKHNIRAEHALESESAYRILEVHQQLKSAYHWAEQTRNSLDKIQADEDDEDMWAAIRGVHQQLSLLHSQISRMQLSLQDIQRKQIDIARYGLTHIDYDNFLINASVTRLSELIRPHLFKLPRPGLFIEDAFYEVVLEVFRRDRVGGGTPRGWDTEVLDAHCSGEPEVAVDTEAFAADMRKAPKAWSGIEGLLKDITWEIGAYRFSLMTLIADREVIMEDNEAFDPMLDLAVQLDFDPEADEVSITQGGETWTMTAGTYRRAPLPGEEPDEPAPKANVKEDNEEDDKGATEGTDKGQNRERTEAKSKSENIEAQGKEIGPRADGENSHNALKANKIYSSPETSNRVNAKGRRK